MGWKGFCCAAAAAVFALAALPSAAVAQPPHAGAALPPPPQAACGLGAPALVGLWLGFAPRQRTPALAHGVSELPRQAFVWPEGVRQIAVAIPTGAGEGQLAGNLTVPTARPPVGGWPGAVILAGSGPTDRNGDNPGEPVASHPYEKLAAYLSSHGVAVLRFDKRGIAGSSSLPVPDSIDRYATDARWAALHLAQQPGVNPRRIVLIGHSLGSTLALLASEEKTPRLPAPLGGIVSLEGSGRTLGQVLLWQLRNRLPPAALQRVQRVVNAIDWRGAWRGCATPPA